MSVAEEKSGRRGGIEVRSIDYVPLSERHGKLWHLGPLWFMSNAQIATLAVGVVSVSAGGNLIWSLLAIILGVVLGTFFMAAHSAQGPQLGLPQMIQSRPQFGYVGAILVWLFAYLQYAGFNVFNSVLAGESMSATVPGSTKLWVVVVTVVAAVASIVGYDFIHKMEQGLTYGFLLLFGILTIVLFTLSYPAGCVRPRRLQAGAVPRAVLRRRRLPDQLGDLRLGLLALPASGRHGAARPSTGRTAAPGSAPSGSCASVPRWPTWAGKTFTGTGIPELQKAGDHVFNGFGGIILVFSAAGLLSVMALNMYGGSLTLLSAFDSFKRVQPTLNVRLITVSLTAVLSLAGALASTESFLTNFENFLLLVLYFFIPWTAVNLVDYFIVRHGHYAIAEIFKPNGIYGRWGWRGIISYLVGFAAMIPFFSIGTPSRAGWRAQPRARTSRCSSGCRSPASSTGCCAATSTSTPRRRWPSGRPTRSRTRPTGMPVRMPST